MSHPSPPYREGSNIFQEGDTGLVDLQEDTEELVRSMIGYLYTMNFAVDHLDNIKDERSHNCTHKRGFHSYNNDTCFLAPYAFIVDMYTLGDKYDIPGLRAKACAHLKELFDLDPLRDWEHEIAVWEYTYQHSRKTDELRALLVNKITTDFVQHLLGESERFYPFVLRCPELTDALLKAAHEKMNDLTGPKALGC